MEEDAEIRRTAGCGTVDCGGVQVAAHDIHIGYSRLGEILGLFADNDGGDIF